MVFHEDLHDCCFRLNIAVGKFLEKKHHQKSTQHSPPRMHKFFCGRDAKIRDKKSTPNGTRWAREPIVINGGDGRILNG